MIRCIYDCQGIEYSQSTDEHCPFLFSFYHVTSGILTPDLLFTKQTLRFTTLLVAFHDFHILLVVQVLQLYNEY